MCGRYVRKGDGRVIYGHFEINDIRVAWKPSYNVAPTVPVPVVRQTGASRELTEMRWGLRPAWAPAAKKLPPMHNARAETVATRPSFREAFKIRRCILPASGYYEWQAGRQPYYFEHAGGEPLAIAAIWEHHPETGDSVSLITTRPNREAAAIHDRMPVLLPRETWLRWLEPLPLTPGESAAFLGPGPDGILHIQPVSRAVGNIRNDHPDLIRPVPPPQPELPL